MNYIALLLQEWLCIVVDAGFEDVLLIASGFKLGGMNIVFADSYRNACN